MATRRAERLMRGTFHRRALLIAIAFLLALANPVLAEDGPTYGARPAPGAGDRSSGTFNLTVAEGSSVSDAVEVLNLSNESATFDVYAGGVVSTSGGGQAPAAREAAITGAATWISVSQATVEVPPRSAATVPFTIHVPGGTPRGDHTAALLVEAQDSDSTAAIASRTRIGLWIKLSVTPAGENEGPASTPWTFSWLILIPPGIALLVLLLYLDRHRLRRWLQNRREEQALLRDFRGRRRQEGASTSHHR
jgi:hypothetical protein